jgi:hypothetical protein
LTLAQTPSDVACLEITASGGRLVIGRFNVLALATKTFEMAALPLGEVLFSATVSGISNSVALAAGGHHTCALLADGTVACWGDNERGSSATVR